MSRKTVFLSMCKTLSMQLAYPTTDSPMRWLKCDTFTPHAALSFKLHFIPNFQSELKISGGTEDNSKIILLISQ